MKALRIPTEAQEQTALFQWAALEAAALPELNLLYHVPNGGERNARAGAAMKRQGVRPGVPDLCLPVSRGAYHGLYIELKRREGGSVSPAQKEWLEALRRQGYCAIVCRGAAEAQTALTHYLRLRMEAEA